MKVYIFNKFFEVTSLNVIPELPYEIEVIAPINVIASIIEHSSQFPGIFDVATCQYPDRILVATNQIYYNSYDI